MHSQGRIKFIIGHTPFSFPLFVIWKNNTKGHKKIRAVVDIQKLNKSVIPDSYLLLLQSKIIAIV